MKIKNIRKMRMMRTPADRVVFAYGKARQGEDGKKVYGRAMIFMKAYNITNPNFEVVNKT